MYEPNAAWSSSARAPASPAVDEIRFEPRETGTRIDYVADIRLMGLMRLAAPFAGGAFARIARDARDGMQRALDGRAAGKAVATNG